MKNPRIIQTIKEASTYLIPTYRVGDDGLHDCSELKIKLCKGNKEDITAFRQDGIFTESLLQVCLEYLQSVNVGSLASRDTSIAITHIEDALLRLGKRAEDRKLREVQGTYNK